MNIIKKVIFWTLVVLSLGTIWILKVIIEKGCYDALKK